MNYKEIVPDINFISRENIKVHREIKTANYAMISMIRRYLIYTFSNFSEFVKGSHTTLHRVYLVIVEYGCRKCCTG